MTCSFPKNITNMEQHLYLFALVVKEPEGVGGGLVEVEGSAVAGLRTGDRKVGWWVSTFGERVFRLATLSLSVSSSSEEGREGGIQMEARLE